MNSQMPWFVATNPIEPVELPLAASCMLIRRPITQSMLALSLSLALHNEMFRICDTFYAMLMLPSIHIHTYNDVC